MIYKILKKLFIKKILKDIEEVFGFSGQYNCISMEDYDFEGAKTSMSWDTFREQYAKTN